MRKEFAPIIKGHSNSEPLKQNQSGAGTKPDRRNKVILAVLMAAVLFVIGAISSFAAEYERVPGSTAVQQDFVSKLSVAEIRFNHSIFNPSYRPGDANVSVPAGFTYTYNDGLHYGGALTGSGVTHLPSTAVVTYTYPNAAILPDGSTADVKVKLSNFTFYKATSNPGGPRINGGGGALQITAGSGFRPGSSGTWGYRVEFDHAVTIDGLTDPYTYVYSAYGMNQRPTNYSSYGNWNSTFPSISRTEDAIINGNQKIYLSDDFNSNIEGSGGTVTISGANIGNTDSSYQSGFAMDGKSGTTVTYGQLGSTGNANNIRLFPTKLTNEHTISSGENGKIETTKGTDLSTSNASGDLDDGTAILDGGTPGVDTRTYGVPFDKKMVYTMTPDDGFIGDKLTVDGEECNLKEIQKGSSKTFGPDNEYTVERRSDGKYVFEVPTVRKDRTIHVTWIRDRIVGSVNLFAEKSIDGREFMSGDEFRFELSGKNNAPLPTQTPLFDSDGNENNPDEVVTTITPGSGTREKVDLGAIVFEKGDLVGRTVTYGSATQTEKDCVNTWFDTNGDEITTQTIPDDATSTFYDNTFTYYVTETPKHPDGVENDNAVKEIIVHVYLDDKNGKMYVDGKDCTISDVTKASEVSTGKLDLAPVYFTNTYDAVSDWDETDPVKILKNRPLERNQFKFKLEPQEDSDAAWLIRTAALQKLNNNKEPLYYKKNGVTEATLGDGGVYETPVYTTEIRDSILQDVQKRATSAAEPDVGANDLYGPIDFANTTISKDILKKKTTYYPSKDVTYWTDGGILYGPIPDDAVATEGGQTINYSTATDQQRIDAEGDMASSNWKWTDTEGIVGAKGTSYTCIGTTMNNGVPMYYSETTDPSTGKVTRDLDQNVPSSAEGYYYESERTLTYKLWEVDESSSKPGYTYDAHKDSASAYEVKVKVEDNGDGTLKISQTPDNKNLRFENEYKAEGDALIKVTKKMDGRDEFGRKTFPDGSEVKFTISKVTGDAPLPSDAGNSDETTVSLPAGQSSYTLTDTEAFNIKFETRHLMDANQENYIATRNKDGLYERNFVYKITENVTDGSGTDPEDPEEGLQPGTDPKDSIDTRNFILVAVTVQEDNEGNIKVVAINGADRTDLENDEYKNQNIAIEGYDPATGKGTWDYESVKMDPPVKSKVKAGTIYNTYQASGEVDLSVKKKLEGRVALEDNMFYFELRNAKDDSVVDEKPNTGADVKFDPIVYNLNQVRADAKAGRCEDTSGAEEGPWIYEYKVKELIPEGDARSDKITKYDTSEQTIKVEITDNGDGTLKTEIIEGTDIEFVNESDTITVGAEKKWLDEKLEDLPGYDRPKSVSIELTANDEVIGTAHLSESNNWQYEWKGLPRTDEDDEYIIYRIAEKDVPHGYTCGYQYANIRDMYILDPFEINSDGKLYDENGNRTDKTDNPRAIETICNIPNISDIYNADIVIHKVDSVTGKNLSGAEFTLTGGKQGDSPKTYTYTTDQYGMAYINFSDEYPAEYWKDADSVSYTLSETSAPAGYEKHADTYTVTKAGNSIEVRLEPENQSIFQRLWNLIVSGTPEGYDEDNRVLTIKNTPKMNAITVTKVWDDKDNNDGKRTDVKVSLKANGGNAKHIDGSDVQPLTLATGNNHDDDMTGEWKNLPAYKDGQKIIYTVEEDEIEGYEAQISEGSYDEETKTQSFTIINKHEIETVEKTLTKQWGDWDNAFNTRPDLQIKLTAIPTGNVVTHDAYGNPIKNVLTAADADPQNPNIWRISVILPKYKDGSIAYYGWEEFIPEGYICDYYNMDYNEQAGPAWTRYSENDKFDNSSVGGDLKVTKTWDDDDDVDDMRPTPEEFADSLILFAGNMKVDDNLMLKIWRQVEKTGDNEYTVTYNLPIWDKNGDKIKYSVEEKVPEGYTLSGGPTPANVEFSITERGYDYIYAEANIALTNKHMTETTKLSINKVWEDGHNKDGKRPAPSEMLDYFKLYQKIGTDGEWTEVTDAPDPAITGVSDTEYTISWSELPRNTTVDGKAVAITYAATEKLPSDSCYRAKVGSDVYDAGAETAKVEQDGTITNSLDLTAIRVKKIWDDNDNQDGKRPDEITVNLKLADGSDAKDLYGENVEPLTLTASDGWSGDFKDVPRTDSSGAVIEYSVVEDPVSGYEPSVTGDAANGFKVTNSHTPETTESVTAEKVWEDGTNTDMSLHTDVTLHLYGLRDGLVVYDAGTKVIEMDDSGQPIGEATWTKLPKHHYSDSELEWQLVEEAVTGYAAEVTGDIENGFTVTNTYEGPVADISVSKEWNDFDDAAGKRPGSITYQLWKRVSGAEEDELVDEQEVRVADDGSADYTWKDLPVTEEQPDGEATESTRKEYQEVTKYQNVEDQNDVIDEEAYNALTDEEKAQYEETAVNEVVDVPVEVQKYKETAVMYYVKEVQVEGYEEPIIKATGAGEFTAVNNLNLSIKLADFKVIKVWDDDEDAAGARPEYIGFKLSIDGEEYATARMTADESASGSSKWENVVFKDVPLIRGDEEITLEESVAGGYTSVISEPQIDEDGTYNYTVTNTYNRSNINLTVTKIWKGDDKNKDKRKDITLHLMKVIDGDAAEVKGQTKTIKADKTAAEGKPAGSATWSGLPSKEKGKDVSYYVKEDAVDGYSTGYSDVKRKSGSDFEATVTNTYREKPKPAVSSGDVIYLDPKNSKSNMIVGSTKYDSYEKAEAAAKSKEGKPANPKHKGVKFIGWDLNIDDNGNFILVAMYSDVPTEVTPVVSYIDPQSGKPVLVSEFADDPSDIDAPDDPSHDNMQFLGWVKTKDAAGNTIFVAKYACDCRNGSPDGSKSEGKDVVKTGDDNILVLWVMLVILSAAFLLTVLIRNRVLENGGSVGPRSGR